MPNPHEPPDKKALTEGLLAAVSMIIAEADLGPAVGESGAIVINLRLTLDHGRARVATGSCFYERRMELRT